MTLLSVFLRFLGLYQLEALSALMGSLEFFFPNNCACLFRFDAITKLHVTYEKKRFNGFLMGRGKCNKAYIVHDLYSIFVTSN